MTEHIGIPYLGLNRPHTPTELNPHRDTVLDSVLGWAATHLSGVLPEKFEELAKVGVGLAAAVGPDLDPRGLNITALQNVWLYGFDAFGDGEAAAAPGVYETAFDATRVILEDPTTPASNPLAAALQTVALLVNEHPEEGHFAPWAEEIGSYLDGVTQEMAYQREGVTPPLEAFVDLRRKISGVGVVFSLIAPARRITIPDDRWSKAAVSTLAVAGTDTIAFDNDILSYRGETARNGAGMNLITIIQRAQNCSIQEAVRKAVRMRNEGEGRFLRAFSSLHEDAGTHPAVLQYAKGVIDWINGHLQFAEGDPRYGGSGN